jgi:hypothetical protein
MIDTIERPKAHDGNGDIPWNTVATVEMYHPEDVDVFDVKRCSHRGLRRALCRCPRATTHRVHEGARPFHVETSLHNLLLNAGIARLEDKFIGAAGQVYDAAHSRIGVGNSATAAAATQTDLQAVAGAANRQFKLCDQGPTRASQTVTWRATFASGEAVFVWTEWGIDEGTADGTTVAATMLNRKVANPGTKGAAVWVFTVTVTIS